MLRISSRLVSRGPRLAPVVAILAALLSLGARAQAQVLSAEATQSFNVADFATGLTNPTDVGFLPDGRVLVTIKGGADALTGGQPGGIVVYSKTGAKEATLAGVFPQPYANHAGGEQGVLGLVVDPDFSTNHLIYVFTAAGPSDADKMHVDAYALDGVAPNFTVTKKQTLVSMLIHGHRNHVGGGMDIHNGMLYIAVGEGGYVGYNRPGGGDVIIDPTFANPTPKTNLAQCLNWGNGKILRIRLDGSIPTDAADPNPLLNATGTTTCAGLNTNNTKSSPFASGAPNHLVWAWGLRNPYRIWVDPMTGSVWTGDVGDGSVEEIDILEKGKNYGWPFFEGDKQRSLEANWATNFPADAATTTCHHVSPAMACAAPALTYTHGMPVGDFTPTGTGASIMGGLIPGTANWPEAFRKKYFFGDFTQQVVFTVDVNDARTAVEPATVKVFMRAFAPTGFRMSPDGVLYLVSHGGGSVYTVTPKGGPLVPEPDPVGGAGGMPGLGAAGAEMAEGGAPGEPSGAGGGGGAVDSPSDGGVPSGGPGPSAEGGMQGGGAVGGESSDPMRSGGDDGGCGCHLGRTTQSGAWAAIALALLWHWRRRRGQR